MANILSDVPTLAAELSQGKVLMFFVNLFSLSSSAFGLLTLLEVKVTLCIRSDMLFLQGLLDVFPFTSDDIEARSALWNIIARLLLRVKENKISLSTLQQCVSVLVSKSDVIEDDLLDCQLGGLGLKARNTAVSCFVNFLLNSQLKCNKVVSLNHIHTIF